MVGTNRGWRQNPGTAIMAMALAQGCGGDTAGTSEPSGGSFNGLGGSLGEGGSPTGGVSPTGAGGAATSCTSDAGCLPSVGSTAATGGAAGDGGTGGAARGGSPVTDGGSAPALGGAAGVGGTSLPSGGSAGVGILQGGEAGSASSIGGSSLATGGSVLGSGGITNPVGGQTGSGGATATGGSRGMNCGDRTLHPGERCDDGNNIGDGCTPWCQPEPNYGIFVEGRYDGSPAFFPLDNVQGTITPSSEYTSCAVPPTYGLNWVPEATPAPLHNFHFTSEARYWFLYASGSVPPLEFTGDDDIWVFINRHLSPQFLGT